VVVSTSPVIQLLGKTYRLYDLLHAEWVFKPCSLTHLVIARKMKVYILGISKFTDVIV